MNLPVAHPVVDDGVDSTVGHGQPVEAEVDVLDVGGPHDLRVVVGVDEVDMVGEPADPKHHNHEGKHLDHLLLVLLALIGAVRVLPRHVIPPEVPPHPDVAHGHAGQGQHVGDGKEEEVVAIVQGGLAWQTIWPDQDTGVKL